MPFPCHGVENLSGCDFRFWRQSGGGGNSDQTFFLQVLLKAGAKDVLLGEMTDRSATDACYKAGVGAIFPLSIGATLDPLMCKPVCVAGNREASDKSNAPGRL